MAGKKGVVLSLTNQKGGAGKTTTSAALATIYGEQGYKVLTVDNDPQGNLSLQLGVDAMEQSLPGIVSDLYLKPARETTNIEIATRFKGVSLIAASVAMSQVELLILNKPGADLLLNVALEAYKARYDLIILDSPPNVGKFVLNVLNASDYFIVPVDGTWALRSVDTVLELARANKEAYKLSTDFLGVFLTMVTRTKMFQALREDCTARFGDAFFKSEIRRSTLAQEAAALEIPVPLYAKDSTLVEDYRSLASEIATRLNLQKGAK
jgi:chromosome partitioning protein